MAGGGQGQQNQQGGGNFGQQGRGVGGSNQGSASPHPQAGFQPPTGPAAQNQQGDQGGFSANMEGYSPQQIAIMQQQQGGQGGYGGGRRGGRGRGRHY
jgi:pre-mRNA 3'-end-processing factor FIP1